MLSNEKIFSVLCTLFAVIVILSNLIYKKFVALNILLIPVFELSAGALLYPFSFFVSNLIAEFYGKEKAKFCVRTAIVMSATVALLILLVDILPSTSWSNISQENFHNTFGSFGTMFIISMTACYISQSLDIPIYLIIQKLTKGKYLWARNSGSTMVSLFVDTAILTALAVLAGIMPVDKLWLLIFNSYSWKVFFTVCGIPFFYLAVWFIRSLENK